MTPEPCLATVLGVHTVTPLIRRIVFGGAGLARFATPVGALGPYLKFRLPVPDGRICIRTYSIRRFDRNRGELHVDVVLHGGAAPGSTFASNARPGDTLALGGPGHIPAAPAPSYLLAGDHTAVPAIAHILDHLPAASRILAIVEVPGAAEERAIADAYRPITWLHRPAGTPSRLPEAVRDFWPSGEDLFVWAGAEATLARAIRSHARSARLVPAERCQVLNYWKSGEPEGGFSYVA